ncbi:putative 43kDa postsynaptic protein [Medicago truncatula]|uniref:Inactive TPR repeat thioredoxin TTL3-like protein n=1 Tax=Medicago truncatula TaxID=3880 RepID=G7KAB8_MEDTR|nr:TPR repeat-containing thioredoxin TTL1 [Medicago truncatula]AES98020.1 inactive TPR repeat thioredoxin TTL3-like protein [Medicago truncatula]RHN56101.1 putative 43kDa postsynaptic protein [Medicago truncatula]
MAMKTKSNKVGNEFGCGFMERIFNLKSPRLRNSLVHSLPMKGNNIDHVKNEAKLFPNKEPKVPQKISNENRKRSSDATARSSTSSSSGASSTLKRVEQNHNTDDDVKLQIESARNSLQLARISTIRTRDNKSNKSITKDFSPLKLTGNLLVNNTPRRKSVDSLPKHLELNSVSSFYNGNNNGRKVVMGNIMRKNSNELAQFLSQRHNIADPEVLKSMGNEAYKKGKFEEALALYDKAIAIDSNKATYHCNKSAALIGLGRFQEAIIECEESIRLDPSYNRAHNRLATIYFRLGDVEKALDCNRSTSNVDSVLAFQAQALQNHLKKCIEARKFNEWSVVLKETQSALSLGADSAPQIYALQTEALLKLVRYQEAYAVYDNMPKFSDDWCNKIFGMATSAYLSMISALVYLASGRFEEAVKTSQQADRVDPSNREVNAVLRRAKAVTSSRMSGNLLFKASKFMEACAVYNEGLDHDPHNSVLLCNRAACRSKLGQYEKAIEDCDAALMLNPCYSKARLRRAYCNAKLERWEVAIQDYEMLIREKPGDEEVARALFEARLQLKMLRGEDIKDLKFGSNLVFISSNDRFRHYVTSPGMAVVLFSNKGTHKQVSMVLEQTSKRFPSVNFLKVEIEDHPYLAKSEGVSSFPAFKIYKNGSRVKEISGNNHEFLEKSVKFYSS